MLILALDTTTAAGSVALLRDGNLLYEAAGDPAVTHGERLPSDLIRACEAAGVSIADVTRLAVAAGPGSFTGLRIGISTLQGLAMARSLSIVPVATLEAIAASATLPSGRIAAWLDARRGEVFAQVFEASADGNLEPLSSAVSLPPEAAIRAHQPWLRGAVFHGEGAALYRDAILTALGTDVAISDDVPPLAGAIARIAARHPDRAVLPHAVAPIYVRRPDAELARDRRDGRA